MSEVARGVGWELRRGRWQDVLADVECDALITDPPYSARTHESQAHGRHLNQAGTSWVSARGLGYASWGAADVAAFVAAWTPRVAGWCAVFCDDELCQTWKAALREAGRYVFAPLPAVQRGMNVRLAGDGPSSWTTWIVVSRPASLAKWGTLGGAYVGAAVDAGEALSEKSSRAVAGAKPLWLMRAIVRDYTRPGDLVCDPCAGGGTTLLAAVLEGRRAIGAEMDATTFAKAAKRLQGVTLREVYDCGDGIPRARQQRICYDEDGPATLKRPGP